MEDKVRRSIMIALIALLALAVAVPTALAAPQDAGGTIRIKANDHRFPGACDFPLLLELSGKGNTITRPDGGFILTSPDLNVIITNLDNPENQVTYNITGSVHPSTDPETGDVTTVVKGRNLLIDPQAGTVIAIGTFSFVFDAKGNLIQPLEGEGQLIDVCAALQ
jgi:hypothetical protein